MFIFVGCWYEQGAEPSEAQGRQERYTREGGQGTGGKSFPNIWFGMFKNHESSCSFHNRIIISTSSEFLRSNYHFQHETWQ